MFYSPHPAERVATEAHSRLGAHLAARGFALVASGPTGLVWRRELGGPTIAVLVFLALMLLGGLGSGIEERAAGTAIFGLACGIGGVVLFLARRPATVTIQLRPLASGCEIDVHSTIAAPAIEDLIAGIAAAQRGSAAAAAIRGLEAAYVNGALDAEAFEAGIEAALADDAEHDRGPRRPL